MGRMIVGLISGFALGFSISVSAQDMGHVSLMIIWANNDGKVIGRHDCQKLELRGGTAYCEVVMAVLPSR